MRREGWGLGGTSLDHIYIYICMYVSIYVKGTSMHNVTWFLSELKEAALAVLRVRCARSLGSGWFFN